MSFISVSFVLFFILVFILYYLSGNKGKQWILLLSGMSFYLLASWQTVWNPLFIVFNAYFFGRWIAVSSRKNSVLFFAVIIFVLYLLAFKYLNLLLVSGAGSSSLSNGPAVLPWAEFFIPVGISFMSFQALGYLIDVKRGDLPCEKNLLYLSNLILFFPRILSGPIESSGKFLAQLKHTQPFSYPMVTDGLKLFFWGLFKKIVIADRLILVVNEVYNSPGNYHGLTILFVVFLFSWQLYMDFSGYTDMAIGIGKMLGFNLTQNFNRPFSALSMTEFWRRWHITLSSWFRDYFYTPLAVNRRHWGKPGVVLSLILTFTLLGVWHGLTWGFLCFGLLQGLALAGEFMTSRIRDRLIRRSPAWITRTLGTIYTFSFFSFSLVFFHAPAMKHAFGVFSNIFVPAGYASIVKDFISDIIIMLRPFGIKPAEFLFALICIIFIEIISLIHARKNVKLILEKRPAWVRMAIYYCLIMIVILGGYFEGGSGFLYAQF